MDQKPWLKNYDEGVPHTLEYPDIPLFQLLEDSASKFPDSTCTIFKGARISYREMNAVSDRLAAGLAEIGVKKGPVFIIAVLSYFIPIGSSILIGLIFKEAMNPGLFLGAIFITIGAGMIRYASARSNIDS